MTPAQFLGRLKQGVMPSLCLFLGAEAFYRRRCRQALIEAHLGPEGSAERESGLTFYDASETALSEIIDDARSLSLFASNRVIVVTSAEAAAPRPSRAAAADEGDNDEGPSSTASEGSGALITQYAKDPSPGVVLLLEATRFELEGDDKKKSDRVRKFYSGVNDVVEFAKLAPEDARSELNAIAKRLSLKMDAQAANMLVESLAADMGRIATELEKLSLYAAGGRTITADDIALLIPDARESTVFALVNALGREDRERALNSLDALVREGEYLPLALAFLSTQFRQALAARKAGLRSSQQIQGYFAKLGVQMWGSRAEQVAQTAQKFSTERLERALQTIFEADRNLRDARPDDRTVMEDFIVKLTTQ
jgi:DNA polymerase-3 subunit delta